MKVTVAVLCVSLNDVVIKQQFFTFVFAVFLPQSTSVISKFRFSKQMAAMWNYTSGLDFGPTVVIGIRFGIGLHILSELDDR